MPRIRCHYLDCAFLDDGYCSAGMVEMDPDTGCKTYSANVEAQAEDSWDEEEEDELEEWEEVDPDEDEEYWGDEDEDAEE